MRAITQLRVHAVSERATRAVRAVCVGCVYVFDRLRRFLFAADWSSTSASMDERGAGTRCCRAWRSPARAARRPRITPMTRRTATAADVIGGTSDPQLGDAELLAELEQAGVIEPLP